MLTAVVLPALAAGLIAIAVTRLIERFGGMIGGLLGTLPTTIVPAAAGILAASPRTSAFRDAMGAVPVGMAINGLALYAWQVLPPRLPGSSNARLAGTLVLSLGIWTSAAAFMVIGLDALRLAGVPPLVVGLAAFVALEAAGVWVTRTPRAAPRGTRTVGWATLGARGVLAAAAIASAALFAMYGGELLAGMASVFPAIFLTTMVSLWWSQGEAVPAGAVGPMLVGSGAVSAYALLAAITLPGLGLVLGSLVAWVLSAVAVTVPAWLWLRRGVRG